MRVKCVLNQLGPARFGVEIGKEYVVLALEASTGNDGWTPPGLLVLVGRDYSHARIPINCVQIRDSRISASWQIGQVQERWLIGYPLMLDETFQIGLERGEDVRFAKMYSDLLHRAHDEAQASSAD